MHDIARHSIVGLVAFAISRILSLAVVGLVISEYGLAAYGLIMLARSLLPRQLFALLTFGLPEVLTWAIARDLASDKPREAVQRYRAAALVLVGIGLLLALPLILAAGPVAAILFDLGSADQALLAPAVIAHGAALPLLFAGVASKSALRGQEDFKALRTTELLTYLAYGIASLALIQLEAGPVSIALAYLGSYVLKAFATIWLAHRRFPPEARRGARPSFRLLVQEGPYVRAQIARRFGAAFTGVVPRLAVAHFLGPAVVGLFEALLRIPRVLRSLITVINSVVVPVVVRMAATGRQAEVASIAMHGPRLLLAMASLVTLPPILLPRPLLDLWLGPEVATYWPWFAALCASPLLQATIGFWMAMGMADVQGLRQQNRIGRIRAVIMVAVALPLIDVLGAAAFWLALLAGMAYALPAVMLQTARRYSQPVLRLVAPLGLVVAASLPATAVGLLLQLWIDIDSWPRFLTACAIVSAVQAIMLGVFVVRPEERRSLLKLRRAKRA